MVENRSITLTKDIAEAISEAEIGQLVLPSSDLAVWQPDRKILDIIYALNRPTNTAQTLRDRLGFNLNHNSPTAIQPVAHRRGYSAYFTYNPNDDTVIVEYGKINPANGEAKLHDYLNAKLGCSTRAKQGMTVSSGHLAELEDQSKIYFAMLDRLTPTLAGKLTKTQPLGKVINTLYSYKFIPLTGDQTVCLPIF